MAKLVWWLLVGAAVFLLWRTLRRRAATPAMPPAASPPRPSPSAVEVQPMVRCDHCGVHLAASDALQAHGRHYCCEAHQAAAAAARADR
ncbi:MAG: hypothetical protein L6Q75_10705 [Burkholderiaceae bacterium]|nr:hypothetical protein [Burkholderiaceae bacterium]